MEINLIIPGKPVGKARPKINTHTHTAYTPTKTANYENFVKMCFINKYPNLKPLETNLKVKIEAFFEIPTSYSKKKKNELIWEPYPHKPDIDNIAKIILDALNGIAYIDDIQIVQLEVEKCYGEKAEIYLNIMEVTDEKLEEFRSKKSTYKNTTL